MRLTAALLVICLSGCLGLSDTYAQPPSRTSTLLCVAATCPKTQAHLGTSLPITVRVRNCSPTAQTFQVMGCSWTDQWQSDVPTISFVGSDCAKNGPASITLQPGGVYEKTGEIYIAPAAKAGLLTFRLRFHPIGSRHTYPSHPITLQIKH